MTLELVAYRIGSWLMAGALRAQAQWEGLATVKYVWVYYLHVFAWGVIERRENVGRSRLLKVVL